MPKIFIRYLYIPQEVKRGIIKNYLDELGFYCLNVEDGLDVHVIEDRKYWEAKLYAWLFKQASIEGNI